ncbi:chloride channel CLIC-like protein 1 [Gadus chalcogrammus]|uniref:chloride channel CLIC-like protein 1 n=1 Tax=Gadus chalcogrammus TaxID=1042646 RepID=UPI0024C4971A|nr:chloride channel CLIC-like protein 1 [Gadus chalcogrammus]
MSQFRVGLRLVVLMCSLAALVRTEEEWLDPYDMLNYDAGTKTMKKQSEPTTYPNVPTKRREHAVEEMDCSSQVSALKTEVEDLRRALLISTAAHMRPVFLCVLVIAGRSSALSCGPWSPGSSSSNGCSQSVSLVSIVWNWFYLYKIEFAQHQSRLAKMDTAYEKCTGMKKIDWTDNLKEWYRTTWTLQDDPCNEYYKDLMVSPFLLVPPSKAFSVTITTFFTEPLKHIGQGISEFLRALLKDLPITLQLPVLITIVLSILVVMYGGVQAMFQHGIMGPLRLRDPPLPPAGAQPQLAQCQPAQPPPAQVQPAQPPPAYL